MNRLSVLLPTAFALAALSTASAQFTQQPDTGPNNLGVRATFTGNYQGTTRPANPAAGDDWVLAGGGAIPKISLWGSWLNDSVDPTVMFKLSIHRDNPAGPGGTGLPYGRPGVEIWSYVGQAANYTLAASGISGNFYDFMNPSGGVGSSSKMYRYDFNFSQSQFVAEAGVTYWLVVQAQTAGGKSFAWNSSSDRNGDAAVFGNTATFGATTRAVYNPLTYDGLPMDPDTGNVNAFDLAFNIVPEPSSVAILGLGLLALAVRRKVS